MDKCIETQRLEGLRRAQARVEEERQAARPRGQLLHRVRRHLQRPHGHALRSRPARSPSSAAPIRTARATPPCSRSSCTNCSACRSRASATCRATPRRCAIGRGTYGARSAVVGGNALKSAADAMIEKGKQLAAAMMEADAGDIEFKDGSYRVTGTDKAIALIDVAKASYAPMGPLTEKFGIGLEATGSFEPDAAEPSQRLPCLRARGRSGDRRGDGRPLSSWSTISAACSIR